MESFFSNLTVSNWITLGIWLVALVVAVMWGQTFRKRQRDIIGKRKYYYIFSGVVLTFAICGLLFRGLNYGLDFTGGTVIELASAQKVSVDASAITAMVTSKFPKFDVLTQLSADMTADENGKQFQKINIRVRDGEGEVALNGDQVAAVVDCVKQGLTGCEIDKLAETNIGPTVSGELKRGAVVALIVSLFFQLLYITFRFGSQLRYGVAADVALAHDVIIMIGFYAWAGLPVDSSFVAALLTIAGYSVMDSVVIFDRVREHIHTEQGATYPTMVNHAINETMVRSINTSLTTIVVCVALYYFGGVTLQGFAYALLVGVVAGAYSSIFVASPLLVELDILAQKRDANRREEMRLAAEERAAQGNAATVTTAAASRSISHSSSSSSAPALSGRSRRRVKGMRRS